MARAKSMSRQARWSSAVDQGREALGELQELRDKVNDDLNEAVYNLMEELQEKVDAARDQIEEHAEKARDAMEQLKELQQEYQEWFDNMPDSLQYNSPVGEKLQEITDQFDFDVELSGEIEVPSVEVPEVELDLDELESILDQAEGADLPLGFGRD